MVNVLYIAELARRLLFVGKLAERGFNLFFKAQIVCHLQQEQSDGLEEEGQ